MSIPGKPWQISVGILVIWMIIVIGGGLLQVGGHPTQLDELVKNRIMYGVLVAVFFLLGVITYLKWWAQVGWKIPDNSQNLLFLFPPVLVLLIMLSIAMFTGVPPVKVLALVTINTLMVGISEELMFRGTLLYGAVSSFGIWRAVWITAIIFGSVHTLNGLVTGDFRASTFQALFAGMFGIWIAALRIRLGTIIPVIIVHWLWDCFIFLTGYTGGVIALPFSLVLLIYGIWLLRNYRHGNEFSLKQAG